MADNVSITAGSGTTIAADDIGGVLHQRVKLSQGADGAATDVSSASPLNVTLANTGANATPVVVDLGANNDVTVSGSVAVTGTFYQATQPVSGTVTASAQPGVDIGDVTINNAAGASAVNIQDGGNSITVDGTFWQATQPVSLASVPSHAVTNAGTFATQSTLVPQTLASGATSAMTGTTSTSLIGATASNYIYITQVTVSNSHATVGTNVLLQDGSGGTTLYVIPAAAVYGGATLHFPKDAPLKVPTAGNALYCANETTGASTRVSAAGWKSTVSY